MQQGVPFLDLHRINARHEAEFKVALEKTLQTGWFLQGEATRQFEENFARYCGAQHCIGVGNGLEALTLSLMAQKLLQGWNEEDEVIVPAHTFVATAQAVVRAGLHPVFVDVCRDSFLIDVALIERAITPKTRALLPVHLYGMPCSMEEILSLAEKHQLFVLEDAAQAHGAQTMIGRVSQPIGAVGHATAWSFYPGKNLGALGDGGAITTDDPILAETIRTLANYGAREKYHHSLPGINSRLDELQAAFLDIKLRHLDHDNQQRRAIAKLYFEYLHEKSFLQLPYQGIWKEAQHSVFHIFPVVSKQRDKLQRALAERGIHTLVHYPIPLHQQPCLKDYCCGQTSYPYAEYITQCELSLPISPVMTEQEVEQVIDALHILA